MITFIVIIFVGRPQRGGPLNPRKQLFRPPTNELWQLWLHGEWLFLKCWMVSMKDMDYAGRRWQSVEIPGKGAPGDDDNDDVMSKIVNLWNYTAVWSHVLLGQDDCYAHHAQWNNIKNLTVVFRSFRISAVYDGKNRSENVDLVRVF